MGKARPWMFWSAFPLAICEVLLFMVPSTSSTLQYVYFLVVYTSLNAVFYTANNIAYSTLTALITKNSDERVQMGSFRFIFASAAALIIATFTMNLVGVLGWRGVAILYSAIMLVCNMLSVLLVKELPAEEENTAKETQKTSMLENLKILVRNKYYLLVLAYYLLYYFWSSVNGGVGVYFCKYVLANESLMGLLALAIVFPSMLGLIIAPFLVKKFGIYKVTVTGFIVSLVFVVLFAVFGYMGNLTLMLLFFCLRTLCMSPMTGSLNAIIAETSRYTYLKEGIHLDGTIYSCSSMGIKLGGGIGSAVCGWLLALAGYDGLAKVQTPMVIGMIQFMYLLIPVIVGVLHLIVVSRLNVQKANEALEKM